MVDVQVGARVKAQGGGVVSAVRGNQVTVQFDSGKRRTVVMPGLRATARDADPEPVCCCGPNRAHISMNCPVHGYVEDGVTHKFEPMPGNRKNQPCNRCLEFKSHPNHQVQSTKAKDEAGGGTYYVYDYLKKQKALATGYATMKEAEAARRKLAEERDGDYGVIYHDAVRFQPSGKATDSAKRRSRLHAALDRAVDARRK